MSKIEGINLEELCNKTEANILDEKRSLTTFRIKCVYDNISKWLREKNKIEKQLNEVNVKIQRAEEGLQKLKSGDWNVLDQLAPIQQEKEENKKGE